jgi:hypothetical protein
MNNRVHDVATMIAFALFLALVVVGLTSHLRSGGDLADRDRRRWWPGSSR